jgi:hypothetical protein
LAAVAVAADALLRRLLVQEFTPAMAVLPVLQVVA